MSEATTKKGRGGKRPGAGRKPGYKHHPRTIEKIRERINTNLCIDTLHELAMNGEKGDGVRATAALGLLQFALPKLTATDLTSGGEQLVIERTAFKP
jgi:hypothetical protein